jgi:hypothetical protein
MADAQITTAMIETFNSNVMHMSQQMESRLMPFVRKESQGGEAEFFEQIKKRDSMKRKSGRGEDVEYEETQHDRRMVTTEHWYDADFVDQADKLRLLINPENEYAVAMANSSGRKLDSIIIDALLGTAYTGKKGATSTVLANANKLAAFDGTTATGCSMNVKTLRAARLYFKKNEAIKKGETVVMAITATQADALLANTELTSSDYNSVKLLVDGEVNTFMGFTFVETELLEENADAVTYELTTGAVGSGAGTLAASAGVSCIAFTANRALLLSYFNMPTTKMDVIPTKFHGVQILHQFDVGAVRMEEVQVLQIFCKE